MCGILGFTSKKQPVQNWRDRFQSALNLQAHRGPDSWGMSSPEPRVLLGHRRLSIIDLSPGGHQPMQMDNGRLEIIFNGEIYNFRELREELEAKGRVFKSKSDTEILLQGYDEYGIEGLLKRIRGMFAFGLYDKQRDKLFLVRDRLGVKPLFYRLASENLTFASEIKSILHLHPSEASLNESAISSFLSFRTVLGEETFFREIRALPGGHYLVYHEGKASIHEYWRTPVVANRTDLGHEYYLSKTRELVRAAVERRLVSDVPLGAFLSGGLDSSLLVAVMAQMTPTPPKTFVVGFNQEGFNEFKYAKLVQERYNTDHHEILLSSGQFMEALPHVIRLKDGPIGVQNEIALFLMARELKKHITVVMSGEGADETFGGYGRIFRSPYDFARQNSAKDPAHGFAAAYAAKYGQRSFDTEMDHFLSQYSWMPPSEKWEMLTPDFRTRLKDDAAILQYWQEQFDRVAPLDHYDKYQYLFQTIHLQGLLQRLDTATMGASVESRNPFVDHELVEFCANMPRHYKMRWRSDEDEKIAAHKNSDQISEHHDITKFILREAFAKDLPEEILTRKKVGFPVPLHRWLGGEFKEMARNVLLDPSVKRRGFFDTSKLESKLDDPANFESHAFGLRIWMLLNVELFLNEYKL